MVPPPGQVTVLCGAHTTPEQCRAQYPFWTDKADSTLTHTHFGKSGPARGRPARGACGCL